MNDLAAQLYRRLCDQTRHNIASRRSLCEQSDRYKAERDEARAALADLRARVAVVGWELRIVAESHARGPHWLRREANALAAALAAAPSGEQRKEGQR